MNFQIPADLSVFTDAALRQMVATATTEHNTLFSMMSEDNGLQTSDNFDTLDALKGFIQDADQQIKNRAHNSNRLAEHAVIEAPVEETPNQEPNSEDEGGEYAAPRVAELAPQVTPVAPVTPVGNDIQVFGRMYAAANVKEFAADQELPGLAELAKAYYNKVSTFSALGTLHSASTEPVMYEVARIKRDYPEEFSVYDRESDDEVLRRVIDESRLPGGSLLQAVALRRQELANTPQRDSLVASTGWCAPSETLYDTCFQGAIDGLLDVPEVQARRGGIRHNQGIEFSGVYGAGTGFFNLSEAQIIAAVNKTCIEIPCPSFIDDRLGVTGLCITGNILQNRGYPEFVRDWMRAAMVVSAHQINSLQIAAMVADSVAVSLTAAEPWVSDNSVTTQLLAAVEMAILDIKYRLRMARNATLDVVFPYWVLAQFRADLSRQNGGDALARQSVSDAQIIAWFTARGARPQFVMDWQDAFAPTDVVGAAGNAPGSVTPITTLPTGVKFMVYPTGTWVRAVNDVITLNAIYDSTKLVTNQLTQLFTETGWKMMRMCPVSRVYTVNICASGNTGAQRAVSCTTP